MAAALKRCGPGDRRFNIGLFVCTKMAGWLIPPGETRAGGGCPWVSVSIRTKKLKQAPGAVPPRPGTSLGSRGEGGHPEKAGSVPGGGSGDLLPTATSARGCPVQVVPESRHWARPSHPLLQFVCSWRLVRSGSRSDPTPSPPGLPPGADPCPRAEPALSSGRLAAIRAHLQVRVFARYRVLCIAYTCCAHLHAPTNTQVVLRCAGLLPSPKCLY